MVAAVAMMVDKMVVEVVVTITAIDAAIKIRRSTRTLLVIFVNVFLLMTFAAISLVVLMIVRPMRTCVVSSTIPNTAPRPQTVHSSSPTSRMAVKLQARKAQEV
jgi:membrane protein implicated in regulation of membrane protease activity